MSKWDPLTVTKRTPNKRCMSILQAGQSLQELKQKKRSVAASKIVDISLEYKAHIECVEGKENQAVSFNGSSYTHTSNEVPQG